VLFPGALGDLVLALPAIAGVRDRHRELPLTLAVSGWLRALAKVSAVADEVASLDDADVAGLFGGTRRPAWMAERPILYSWLGARDPDVAARLDALANRAHLLSIVRGDGPRHASAVYRDQVHLDAAADFRWPRLAATPRVDAVCTAARGPLLAVHPGAGSVAKRWAREGFDDVARRWREGGGDVVELVGPAERALAPLPEARRADDWPLADVAALLARVDAFLGNDSGITHLAAAMGARGIAVFGPTDARRWGPCGDGVGTISAPTWSPNGIPLDGLAPVAVWRALERRGCLDKLRTRT
jgi:ADP-heptose:LPS heptosyltransferase